MLPHSSVAVQVLVNISALGQEPEAVVSVNVISVVPQLSVAVNITASVTASHSTVSSAGSDSLKIGAVVSSIVNVAFASIKFPQSSVSVNVTVSVPVVPHRSLNPALLFVIVALPELSVPVKLTNQSAKALFGSAVPSHSTVISAGGFIHVGSSPSPSNKITSIVVVQPESSRT